MWVDQRYHNLKRNHIGLAQPDPSNRVAMSFPGAHQFHFVMI